MRAFGLRPSGHQGACPTSRTAVNASSGSSAKTTVTALPISGRAVFH